MTRLSPCLLTITFCVLISVHSARAAEIIEVFIDARDPAYVVVQGVYDNTPAFAWQEMEGYARLPNVQLLAWLNFRKHALTILAPYVRRDDYPKTHIIKGILALLLKYPGRPFGVSWNGGIASSFFDYQTAAETFEAFSKDAQAYEASRPKNKANDPLHPDNQLPRLLNR